MKLIQPRESGLSGFAKYSSLEEMRQRETDWWDWDYLEEVISRLARGQTKILSKFDRSPYPLIDREGWVVDGTHRITAAYITNKPIEVEDERR